MDDRERDILGDAISLLRGPADCDCYCDREEGCTIDDPKCHSRQCQAAMRRLEDLKQPKVTTMHQDRLTNPAERIYFEAAKKLGERTRGVNGGYSDLDGILNPDLGSQPNGYSHRDAEVVGTFCQWLGTNCGRSFVHTCEREIDKARATREASGVGVLGPPYQRMPCDWAADLADSIVSHRLTPGSKRFASLVNEVAFCFRRLLVVVAFCDRSLKMDEALDALTCRGREPMIDDVLAAARAFSVKVREHLGKVTTKE